MDSEMSSQRLPFDFKLTEDAINSNYMKGNSKRQRRKIFKQQTDKFEEMSSGYVDKYFLYMKMEGDTQKQMMRLMELNRLWKRWLRANGAIVYDKMENHLINKITFLIDMSTKFTPQQIIEICAAGSDPKEKVYPKGKSVISDKF